MTARFRLKRHPFQFIKRGIVYFTLNFEPLLSAIKEIPCKITSTNAKMRIAVAIISSMLEISRKDVRSFKLLKCFIFSPLKQNSVGNTGDWVTLLA